MSPEERRRQVPLRAGITEPARNAERPVTTAQLAGKENDQRFKEGERGR
jgi:hypothetical protein